MKCCIEDLEPFDEETGHVNVIVETPKGSQIKYAYDPESGMFVMAKALPQGMVYPFNFGFVPRTLADDGDPLDMLILNEEPIICGCLLRVRPVAVIKARQTEEGGTVRNDRIIGQAMTKEPPVELRNLKLDPKLISQIETFFATYNQFYGKKFKVLGVGGAQEAHKLIRKAIKLHDQKNEG